MKSVIPIWLAMTLCALFVSSCNKNTDKADQNNSVKAFSEYLGKPIIIDLKGKVLDHDKKPLDSVTIIIGDKSSFTDKSGNYIIKNASVYSDFLSIKAQKKGYKNVLLNLVPKKDTKTVNITLYKAQEPCLFWFCKHNHNLPN